MVKTTTSSIASTVALGKRYLSRNLWKNWMETLTDMSITEKEIQQDFLRFLRHESMRANCKYSLVLELVNQALNEEYGKTSHH